jgi:hypothetical protein
MTMRRATTLQPRNLVTLCGALAALVTACTGKVGDPGSGTGTGSAPGMTGSGATGPGPVTGSGATGPGPTTGTGATGTGATGTGATGPVATGSGGSGPVTPPPPPPPFSPSEPVLARLTVPQYANVIRDLFGAGLQISNLEPDQQVWFFSTIGAATTTLSEQGVDLYGRAAHAIAKAAFSDTARRASLVPCTVTTPLTDACLGQFVTAFGQRAFRRPLAATEVTRYKALGVSIGLADPWVALQMVTAAMLQSPNFLYRVELGEPEPSHAGWLHYTNYEMASRLSFLLRNSFPDTELFAAAAKGELVTKEGIVKQATRLLSAAPASPGGPAPSEEMLSQFYSEYFELPLLDDVQFPATMDPNHTLAASMRNEVLDIINRIALRQPTDMRTIFTTPTTAINTDLAKLYGLTSTSATALQPAQLPDAGPRAGILTTGALLSLNNRPNRTAPTIRGFFIRMRLLCATVPPPPPNIPPFPEGKVAVTVRDKLAEHVRNPTCNACHRLMDPIGLGMEDFDQFGRYRTKDEEGLVVDENGELDGKPFKGARQLGALLAQDPRVSSCMVMHFYRYGSSRLDIPEEKAVLVNLDNTFAQNGYQLKPLMLELVGSDGFRFLVPEAP